MSKVVIITNTDGYFALVKKALNNLCADGVLTNEAAAYVADSESVWDGFWDNCIKGSELVVIEWMGVSLEVPFLQGALAALKRKGIAYKLHAGDEAAGNASSGWEAAEHAKLARYTVYGVMEALPILRICGYGF